MVLGLDGNSSGFRGKSVLQSNLYLNCWPFRVALAIHRVVMSDKYMELFPSESFQIFKLDELPLRRDTWIMDEADLPEWRSVWLESMEGSETASPYEVGRITRIHVAEITDAGAEISWYANTHDRFHEVKCVLPKEAFVTAACAYRYERRVSVFVKTDWLRKLHLQNNSIFAMIDVANMTKAIKSGKIKHENLIALRNSLDEISGRYPLVAFISFADSLLIKTNWTSGMIDTEVGYTYCPENLIILFKELQKIYQATLGVKIYGVFAQGANEYYDGPILNFSDTRNHISLNSLGLPFAQLLNIDCAARKAISDGAHPPAEIYMDEDFFHSLRFEQHSCKENWPRAFYAAKLTPNRCEYFLATCEDLMSCLQKSK